MLPYHTQQARHSRRFSWLLLAGASCLTVLSGLGFRGNTVEANDDQVPKIQAKPAQPLRVVAQPGFDWENLRKTLEKIQEGKLDPQELRKEIANLLKQLPKQPLGWKHLEIRPMVVDRFFLGQGRLGVQVEKPTAVLADQLNLPKDQGLVVTDVRKESPAAKAGLKVHDVLLKVNDQPVSNDPGTFARNLEKIKADGGVTIVVLRHGKEETIKRVALAATKPRLVVPPLPPMPPMPFLPPNIQLPGLPFPGGPVVMTTTMRTGDRFTSRYQEGSLIVTVTGKVSEGKATVQEINVQDGMVSNKYQSADQVPARYRDKVHYVVQISTLGQIRIESRPPEK